MIVSDSHKFIFIAVPKTATSSIERALSGYGDAITKASDGKHIKAADLREEIGADKWNEYFKFAFVRHPLDWVASWYTYRSRKALQDPNHPNHERSTAGMTFREFLQNDRILNGGSSQCDYIMDDDDSLLVDFVGKFESLQVDFDTVCDRIGVPRSQLASSNRSPEGSARDLYDDETRRMVLDANQRELRHLDYGVDYTPDARKGRSTSQYLKDRFKSLIGGG